MSDMVLKEWDVQRIPLSVAGRKSMIGVVTSTVYHSKLSLCGMLCVEQKITHR